MNKTIKNIISVSGGLAIGFVNGFFGGGGGMLCVPLLEKLLKEETKRAHATAILIILPISIVSAIIYIINGFFSPLDTIIAGTGVLAGGIAGALLLKILPPKVIGTIFALMMIGVGIKMQF